MKAQLPPSVNWHIWSNCNMVCRFCFATFGDIRDKLAGKSSISQTANLQLAEILGANFSKVSLAGGEALLCPYIVEIFQSLKQQGTTTALITNGARLIDNPDLLDNLSPHLDWLGISIDSFYPKIQEELGRAKKGVAYLPEQYIDLSERVHKLGIRLKINTVVNQLNCQENMAEKIKQMSPERWKLFQVLPIEGQNDGRVEELLIEKPSFLNFVNRHKTVLGDLVVPESNEAMTGSYAMVDPVGRFFDNTTGTHKYSKPILDIGIDRSFQQISFDHKLFDKRGGTYDWQEKP